MKFKVGQKVLLEEDVLSQTQKSVVSELNPPHIATIENGYEDPHSGFFMYFFKEIPWGWYEHEIAGLYEPNLKNEEVFSGKIFNRFEIIDLD